MSNTRELPAEPELATRSRQEICMSQEQVIAGLEAQISHLHQRLRARSFELDVLYELSTKLSDSLSYEQLFRSILTHLNQAISYDVAAGLLYTGPVCELYLHPIRPLRDELCHDIQQRLLDTCRRLRGTDDTRSEAQITLLKRPALRAGEAPLEMLGSFFQVPIIVGGATVGSIFVGAMGRDQFTEDHVRLLYMVANQASAAVERLLSWAKSERLRLKTIVEHLPEGIVLLTDQNVIAMANPIGRHLLNLLAGTGVGACLTQLGDQTFQQLVQNAPVDLHLEQPQRMIIEVTVIPLDGSLRDAGWMLVLRDITKARDEVTRRDRFMAMLAHELRNPLAPILHAINVLEGPLAAPSERSTATAVLGRQVRHLVHLLDDLLDVSRFLHGKVTLQKQPVNLSQLICRTSEIHRGAVEQRGQKMQLTVQPDLWVFGDETRLNQVISNLISNAVKYTPAKGQITISCDRSEDIVVLRLRDTGTGICKEKLPLIFDAFVQADETLARSEGGLGLGLALVRILVNMHGGTVAATSPGPGQGSTLTVRLPLIASPTLPRPTMALATIPHGIHRVLIIEDNDDARDMLRMLLELEGHEVFVARTGTEGVDVFRRCRPDIALVDIGLPEMDGYRVAECIRRDPHGAHVFLAALTGYAQPNDRARSREAGFDDHLSKPIDVDQLESLLQRASGKTLAEN